MIGFRGASAVKPLRGSFADATALRVTAHPFRDFSAMGARNLTAQAAGRPRIFRASMRVSAEDDVDAVANQLEAYHDEKDRHDGGVVIRGPPSPVIEDRGCAPATCQIYDYRSKHSDRTNENEDSQRS
jgi:hypothetical protein